MVCCFFQLGICQFDWFRPSRSHFSFCQIGPTCLPLRPYFVAFVCQIRLHRHKSALPPSAQFLQLHPRGPRAVPVPQLCPPLVPFLVVLNYHTATSVVAGLRFHRTRRIHTNQTKNEEKTAENGQIWTHF